MRKEYSEMKNNRSLGLDLIVSESGNVIIKAIKILFQ